MNWATKVRATRALAWRLWQYIDFWSIRSPDRSFDPLKEFKLNRIQLSPRDLCVWLYTSDPVVKEAVDTLKLHLFTYEQRSIQEHLEITATDEHAAKAASVAFLGKFSHKITYGWGEHFNLINFLRDVVVQLAVHGRAYYRLTWEETNNGSKARLKHIGYVGNQPAARRRRDGAEECQFAVSRTFPPSQQPELIWLSQEEQLLFEWKFGPKRWYRKSPLLCILDEIAILKWWMVLTLAKSYARANPNDRSFWIERARFTDVARAQRRVRLAERRIRARTCVLPVRLYEENPHTNFYLAWKTIQFRQYLCEFREYLLGVFTSQVIETWARKNGFDDTGFSIHTKGYFTLQELQQLHQKLVNGDPKPDEILNRLAQRQ